MIGSTLKASTFGDHMPRNDDKHVSGFESWAHADPAMQAQRARADADAAAKDAERAKARVAEAERLASTAPGYQGYRHRLNEARTEAANRERFAKDLDQRARAAEAKAVPSSALRTPVKPAASTSTMSPRPVVFTEAFRRRQIEVAGQMQNSIAGSQGDATRAVRCDADEIWDRARAANSQRKGFC